MLAVQRRPLGLVVVETAGQPVRLELLDGGGELAGEFFPVFGPLRSTGLGGEHKQPGTDDLVEFNRLGHRIARRERLDVVMRRIAAQAEIVHQAADFLGIRHRPVIIGRIKLHHFIADLGDRAERVRQVACQFSPYRIKFKADGAFLWRGCDWPRGIAACGRRKHLAAHGLRDSHGGNHTGNREKLPPRNGISNGFVWFVHFFVHGFILIRPSAPEPITNVGRHQEAGANLPKNPAISLAAWILPSRGWRHCARR